MKNPKVSAPDKYSGEDDIETFNTWITCLLRWYQVHNITRATKDSVRVDLCRTTLKGATSKWYLDEVEVWNRPNRHWFFEDLICAMYKRFIHEVTAQNASMKFDHVIYLKSKGTLAFYNDLKRYTGCMVIHSPQQIFYEKEIPQGTTNRHD